MPGFQGTIRYNPMNDPKHFLALALQNLSVGLQKKRGEKRVQGDIRDLSTYGENMGQFEEYQGRNRSELSGVLSAQPGTRLPELANVMQGKMDPEQFNTPIPRRPQFPNLQSPGMQEMASSLMLDRALPQRMTPYQRATVDATKARTARSNRTKTQVLMDEGYTANEAKMIRDIANGVKPRASVRKKYDNMDEVEKLDFLNKLEDRAKGQYYGVTEGYEAAVDQKTLKWVTEEKAKLPMFKKTEQVKDLMTDDEKRAKLISMGWTNEQIDAALRGE